MQEEIEKIKPEVIDAQKEAVIKELATLQIQLKFIEDDHEEKVVEAKKIKDEKEKEGVLSNLAQTKLQKITPMKDNQTYKAKYYEYLCTL